ncbi:MAG: hypothetical protein R3C19_08695 [Planctomycetaceae bacterium]
MPAIRGDCCFRLGDFATALWANGRTAAKSKGFRMAIPIRRNTDPCSLTGMAVASRMRVPARRTDVADSHRVRRAADKNLPMQIDNRFTLPLKREGMFSSAAGPKGSIPGDIRFESACVCSIGKCEIAGLAQAWR